MRTLGYLSKRKLALLKYMLNDHPNRERITGADQAAWTLEMSDANIESLDSFKAPGGGVDRQLASALSQLGYNEVGKENATCQIATMHQAFLGDEEKTNILVNPMTEMFDETTLVTDVALAKKCLEALDQKVIVV